MSNIHFFDASSGAEPLGDLEKTIAINNLLSIPLEERDSQWIADFITQISEANLAVAEPEIIMSNDGFPYFNLRNVANGENFQAFVIKSKLPLLLKNGFGVAINTQKDQPDWMFTYGDLLNLQLNGEFYTDEHFFSKNTDDFAIGNQEEILTGQPSEAILPSFVRQHMRDFLQFSGVHNPLIMLIARNYTDEEKVSQDLVLNLTPKNFANEKEYRHAMNTISWFLPRHYSLVGMDENAIENGFQPL